MAILQLKMKGEAVRVLQQQLMKIGYPPVNEIDFGVMTEKVVKDFQITNGLFPDGQVGPITQGVLDAQLAMPVIQGIDVSEWNGLIDWNKVAKTPYQFFILKRSEGENLVDARFATNYAELQRLNLIKGVYHFYRFFSDPMKQVRNFLSAGINFNDGKTLSPIIDIEWQDNQGSTNARIIAQRALHITNIKKWLAEVELQTGRKPIIYTQKSFWDDILGAPTGFEAYTLWVVDYDLSHAKPALPSGWRGWMLWQYSASGKVYGAPGNTDINRFNGSMTALRKLCK